MAESTLLQNIFHSTATIVIREEDEEVWSKWKQFMLNMQPSFIQLDKTSVA